MKTARNSLEEHVQALAVKFAQDVLAALKGASLSDIASLAGSSPALSTTAAQPRTAARAPAKRARRSAEDLDRTVERLVRALEKAPDGLRAEALRVECIDLGHPTSEPYRDHVFGLTLEQACVRRGKSGQ